MTDTEGRAIAKNCGMSRGTNPGDTLQGMVKDSVLRLYNW